MGRINSNAKLIIQFGRLDRSYRNQIDFSFEGEEGKADLSSSFLLTTKSLAEAKRLIIFPESIILQDELLSTGENDSFIRDIDQIDLSEYLKNPIPFLSKHPQVQNAEMLVVSSLGYFKFKGENYEMSNSFDRITVQIYTHLISNYSADDVSELYVEISSGQNIYISALLNALYRFLPFVKLRRFLKTQNERINAFILSSDPILGKPERSVRIQKSRFLAKAFNSFSYKNHGELLKIVKSIFKDTQHYEKLQEFIEKEYFLLHGSFIYGTPLMLTLTDHSVVKGLFEDQSLEEILRIIENHFSVGKTMQAETQSGLIFSLTFALAVGNYIFNAFSDLIESRKIEFTIQPKSKNDFRLINERFDAAFKTLKELYGQPEPNYKGELKEFIKQYRKLSPSTSEPISPSDLLKQLNPAYKTNTDFNPRNFFAHGGLERNSLTMSIKNETLTVWYNENVKKDSLIRYLKQ